MMAAILIEEQAAGHFGGVLHCFSSGAALAETAIRLGLYISFSGILTFKKSEPLRAIAQMLPLDRLLVETDAPYLAPVANAGPAKRAQLRRPYARVAGCLSKRDGGELDGGHRRQLPTIVRQGGNSGIGMKIG